MKKLSLLLCVFAFAQAVSAQTKFFFMPEIGMGATSIKIGTADGLKYTKERKTCSNLNFGVTPGKTEQKERHRYFIGILLERNGYGFETTCNEDEETINVGTGGWKFGLRMLLKRNSGIVYGGTIGYNVWDDVHTIVESGHKNCYNGFSNPDNSFSANGHVGYSWSHVMLLLNLGYESGVKCCASVAFPIYFVE